MESELGLRTEGIDERFQATGNISTRTQTRQTTRGGRTPTGNQDVKARMSSTWPKRFWGHISASRSCKPGSSGLLTYAPGRASMGHRAVNRISRDVQFSTLGLQ